MPAPLHKAAITSSAFGPIAMTAVTSFSASGDIMSGWTVMKTAPGSFARNDLPDTLVVLRQQMVGFVDDQPVRPRGLQPELRELRQDIGREIGPLLDLHGQHVENDVGVDRVEQGDGLCRGGRRLGVADADRAVQPVIIAFGIDDAELVAAPR